MFTDREPGPVLARSLALSATCRVVALTNVVGRADPFHKATEFATKPVPVSMMLAALPTGTTVGKMPVNTGIGLSTSRVIALLLPPDGAGFCTVSPPVPLAVSADAGSAALISEPLTQVVARGAPFHATTEDGTKPVPEMSSIAPADPARTLEGLTEVTVGTGLLIEKVAACEVPPPGAGLDTVTGANAPSSSLPAGIVAVRLVLLPKAVARATPFHCTADWLTNPVPATVTDRSGEPANTDDGLRLVIAGVAFPGDVVGGGVVEGGVDADCEPVPPQPAVHNGRTIRQTTAKHRGRRPAKIIRAFH